MPLSPLPTYHMKIYRPCRHQNSEKCHSQNREKNAILKTVKNAILKIVKNAILKTVKNARHRQFKQIHGWPAAELSAWFERMSIHLRLKHGTSKSRASALSKTKSVSAEQIS